MNENFVFGVLCLLLSAFLFAKRAELGRSWSLKLRFFAGEQGRARAQRTALALAVYVLIVAAASFLKAWKGL